MNIKQAIINGTFTRKEAFESDISNITQEDVAYMLEENSLFLMLMLANNAKAVLGVMSQSQFDRAVEAHPDAIPGAIERAGGECNLLNSSHIDFLLKNTDSEKVVKSIPCSYFSKENVSLAITKEPVMGPKYLASKVSGEDLDYLIQKKPFSGISFCINNKDMNSERFDQLVKEKPDSVGRFKNSPLFNNMHVAYIVKKAPVEAAIHLKDLLNDKQVKRICKKNPWAAAEFLKDHPAYIKR